MVVSRVAFLLFFSCVIYFSLVIAAGCGAPEPGPIHKGLRCAP